MAINYGPNTALIQGAAKAYKDYSNVPGMYEGIDKVIKTGTDMADKAMKQQEAEKLKAEKDAKAAEDKIQAQDKAWRDATQEVYNNAGSFKSKTDYDFTFEKLEGIKGDLIKAQDSGDQKAIAAANLALNEEKAYIDDMVALRKQFSEMDRSSAMSATKNPYDGNNGSALDIVTAWMNENYEVVENEEGKREFIIEAGNKTYSLTKEELEDMYIPTDPAAGNKYFEIRDTFAGRKRFDRKAVEAQVKGNLPTDTNGLRAFVADPIGNETFSEILDSDKSVREEIDSIFDTDKSTPGIDDVEFKMFKEAVVDPYHSFWRDENGNTDMAKWEKYCRPIVVQKLSNAIENQHALNFPEEVKNTIVNNDFDDTRGTDTVVNTSANNYTENNNKEKTTETSEEKPAGPIAQQMLDEKYSSGKDVFNIDELRSTLASGGVSEEILTKYLSEIPGVTIEDGVAKGLDQKGFKFSTAFNKAMRKLQNEENINLGYK